METKIQVKIKMNNNKEVILDQEEARELYWKLKEVFEKDTVYVPYQPYIPVYPYYYEDPYPIKWQRWTTSSGGTSVECITESN